MSKPGPRHSGSNRRQILGAGLAVVILLVLGIWVFSRLDATQKAQACMESAGRRCAAIEVDSLPKR
ncbi:MAG: hypothetical protein LCH61_19500 [Proteobacteria bacterium]|nr:hypothetical protein [Pseudomonadota bacterium]